MNDPRYAFNHALDAMYSTQVATLVEKGLLDEQTHSNIVGQLFLMLELLKEPKS